MGRSQWGSYLKLYYEKPYVGKEKYKNYMAHLHEKRSKSYKDLVSLVYENGRFYEALDKFIEESDDVNIFYSKNKAKKIEIAGIKSSIDRTFVYKKNMKTLIELCRYHLRKGGKR